MRDAAGKLHNVETPLDITPGVGDDLAMFRCQQMGKIVHVAFDQPLEVKHDTRPALRIYGRPCRLRRHCCIDGLLQLFGRAQADAGLHLTIVRIIYVPGAGGYGTDRASADEVGNISHFGFSRQD